MSKDAIAILSGKAKTDKGKERREKKERSASRVYAAILKHALAYGGDDVGAIVYQSTKNWIEKNYRVPS
jgi:hypothetical protein